MARAGDRFVRVMLLLIPLAVLIALGIWFALPLDSSLLKAFLAWLASINLVALFGFGWDKWLAKRGDARIPERVLFQLVLLGGTFGALAGMKWFRHKTQKASFIVVIALLIALQIAVIALLAYGWQRVLPGVKPQTGVSWKNGVD
ncbi:MAG: DUF1294 domain-containing protein [Gemmataceae bacterium]